MLEWKHVKNMKLLNEISWIIWGRLWFLLSLCEMYRTQSQRTPIDNWHGNTGFVHFVKHIIMSNKLWGIWSMQWQKIQNRQVIAYKLYWLYICKGKTHKLGWILSFSKQGLTPAPALFWKLSGNPPRNGIASFNRQAPQAVGWGNWLRDLKFITALLIS